MSRRNKHFFGIFLMLLLLPLRTFASEINHIMDGVFELLIGVGILWVATFILAIVNFFNANKTLNIFTAICSLLTFVISCFIYNFYEHAGFLFAIPAFIGFISAFLKSTK